MFLYFKRLICTSHIFFFSNQWLPETKLTLADRDEVHGEPTETEAGTHWATTLPLKEAWTSCLCQTIDSVSPVLLTLATWLQTRNFSAASYAYIPISSVFAVSYASLPLWSWFSVERAPPYRKWKAIPLPVLWMRKGITGQWHPQEWNHDGETAVIHSSA